MDNKFSKYSEKGAYHWKNLYSNGWLRASPRLHARYDIPVRLLNQRCDLSSSKGLDVGCGDGVLLYKIRRRGGKVIGLDTEREGLRLAEAQLEAKGVPSNDLIEGSCFDIPLDDESVDYVTAIELIEHLEHVNRFLKEARRVLRPGGHFVCTTPNRSEDQDPEDVRDPFHVHEYVPEELESILADAFDNPKIFGAYPEWLDRIYVRNGRSKNSDKAIRLLFRGVSFGIINPYVASLTTNPGFTCKMIVGLSEKT